MEIPRSTVEALTQPDMLGQWREHLVKFVPLHGYHDEDGRPEIVRVQLDVANDA